MTNNQSIRYEMLRRVHTFGTNHQHLFPPETRGGQAFVVVTEATRELETHAVSRLALAKEGKDSKARARRALTEHMDAIVRSARTIARGTPGFDVRYRMPRPRTDASLLATARLFVDLVGASKDRFVEYGMSADVGTALQSLAQAFEAATVANDAERDGHTQARARFEAALERGLEAVRQLDIIVANRCRGDDVTMAVWERDRRVEYARRARKATPAKALPGPAPAPVPVEASPEAHAPGAVAPVSSTPAVLEREEAVEEEVAS